MMNTCQNEMNLSKCHVLFADQPFSVLVARPVSIALINASEMPITSAAENRQRQLVHLDKSVSDAESNLLEHRTENLDVTVRSLVLVRLGITELVTKESFKDSGNGELPTRNYIDPSRKEIMKLTVISMPNIGTRIAAGGLRAQSAKSSNRNMALRLKNTAKSARSEMIAATYATRNKFIESFMSIIVTRMVMFVDTCVTAAIYFLAMLVMMFEFSNRQYGI